MTTTNSIDVVYGQHTINIEVVGGRGQTGATGPAGPDGPAVPAIGDVLTTKGDIVARSATDAVRVPIGATGAMLVVDPSQPTSIKWSIILDGGTP